MIAFLCLLGAWVLGENRGYEKAARELEDAFWHGYRSMIERETA